MFNVLDRLKQLKQNHPDKYDRICTRLEEIRGSAGYVFGANSDGTTAEDYVQLAVVRKLTDDFFSRLATIDRKNEDFWREIGSRWQGRTELDDLPQPDARYAATRRDEESLIRTIVLSHHPKETFKLMLEYNHPQRILHKLLDHHERKDLLFGVRTKFGLSLGTYLTPKQVFQIRGSLIGDVLDKGKEPVPSDDDRKLSKSYSTELNRRETVAGAEAQPVDEADGDQLNDLLSGSVFYTPLELIRQRRKARRARSEKARNSIVELSADEADTGSDIGTVSLPVVIAKRSGAITPLSDTGSIEIEADTEAPPGPTGAVTFADDAEDKEQLADNESSSSSRSGSDSESEEAKPVDDGAGGIDQYRLQRLKIIFEESDTDDEPGLDINEFKQAMKKILGEDVPEREIELIFMKVDANCDGNVDWNEFLEFTLREFQERDAMTQLAKDAFFEPAPQTVHGTRGQNEIKALIFVQQQGFGRTAQDLTNGRYYTLNPEGDVICWTTDFKKIASFDLIPDARGTNIYIRANDMCAVPEIKAIVVSFTSGEVHFYNYDDARLDLVFSITSLKSPVLCLHYHFQETESILLLGDQAGNVGVIRFKSLHYDGLWGSLGLPHSNNPRVTWSFLIKKGKAYSARGMLGTDWINQVKFFPNLNAMMACSLDPRYSLCVIPFHKQREPIYFSQKHGFNCFDYNDFLNVIVTGSKNRSIQIWNQDNVESPSGHFDGHEGAVNRVICYRDVEFTVLISVDAHHVVKVWDFKDQACLQSYDSKGLMLPHHTTTFMHYNAELEHLVYGARDIVMLKRINLHKKGPVELFKKTHDEPVIGALYNTLFECVVTACQASTIMVWNFQTGDKIIQYRNAHTVTVNGKLVQVPIKSMSFDANQRRLITCASDGLIKLWNFNNGACLSFFDHLEGVDLNVVRYQKNRDLVVAAGWNRYIFMVRDTRGEDDVDESVYEWEKAHRADITAFEIIYAPEGQPFELEDPTPPEDIQEPDIEVDEGSSYITVQIKRKSIEDLKEEIESASTLQDDCLPLEATESQVAFAEHLSESMESTKHESDSGSHKGSSSSGSEDGSGSDGTESGGDSESSGAEERAKLSDDDSFIVSGSSDGELIVWHLFSATPVCFLNTDGCPLALSRKARADYAARTVNHFTQLEVTDSGSIEHFLGLQMLQHQKNATARGFFSPLKDEPITVPKVPNQARHCVTCILVLQNRVFNDGNTASIITASTDGFIRAWSIHYATGGLLGLFYAAHSLDSFITTMYTDEKNELLFTGDTRGYIKVWLLCEWMHSAEHLKGHQHCFDPRNFPFIKRHKIFASLVAFRANYMMKKTVDQLAPAQRGLYRQPYILNSFRGHLLRVTQIQVVYQKKIIISASEDCSVRLWHFSGLYIGTLGQDLAFHNDSIPTESAASDEKPASKTSAETAENTEITSSTVSTDTGEKNSQQDLQPEDDSFLHEAEDPNEVLIKPKVIIPVDLAEKSSLATVQVLYSDRHRRTEIPPDIDLTESDKVIEPNKDVSGAWFDNREDYITALQELTVLKRFEEYKPQPFRYYGHEPHYEVKDKETLVFTHTPLQDMEPVGALETIIPKNLFEYNLSKTQNALLECLPIELRAPYLELQLAGQLVGPALDALKNLVKAREAGLAPVKPVAKDSSGKKQPAFSGKATKSAGDELGSTTQQGAKVDNFRRAVQRVLLANKKHHQFDTTSSSHPVVVKSLAKTAVNDDSDESEPSDESQTDAQSQRSFPQGKPKKACSSKGSFAPLNEDFLNADRIDIAQLQGSEQEFTEDLIQEQERTAKFEYLSLLERGNVRSSQTEPYLSLVRNHTELYNEICPMLEPGVKFHRPSKPVVAKKVRLKMVKSVSSMDRIQRVFKVADFEASEKHEEDKARALRLTVPPLPRRLASVIKGQVRNGKRAASFYNFDELDEPESPLGGKKLWGDQESLAIFDQNFLTLQQRTSPSLAKRSSAEQVKERSKRKSADLADALQHSSRALAKQRLFTNRYIYRQLSDSVLHEPAPREVNHQLASMDATAFLSERKAIRDEERAAKREARRRLTEELYQRQRKSPGFAKARNVASSAVSAKHTHQSDLPDLNAMLDQVKLVEHELMTDSRN